MTNDTYYWLDEPPRPGDQIKTPYGTGIVRTLGVERAYPEGPDIPMMEVETKDGNHPIKVQRTSNYEKVVVDVRLPSRMDLSEKLSVAGQFAYTTRSVAQFVHDESTYQVWYEDFTHGDGWKALQTKDGKRREVPRDNGRWGRLTL